MSGNAFVGIDLGGTKIHGAIAFDDRLDPATTGPEIAAELRVPTSGDLVSGIAAMVDALAASAGVDRDSVRATAVGGAGAATESGALSLAPNLELSDAASFGTDLRRSLRHPVVVENDVNAAAVGELTFGVGREHDDFVVIASGTGIGMGVVSGGRLVRGARGAAGEIGFLPFGADPFDPLNQRRGPLEEVLAGDALAAGFRSTTGIQADPTEIFDLMDGDDRAREAVELHARWLALGLVAVRAIVDPAAVVLTGGIGSRPELLEPLRRALAALGAPDLRVVSSDLGGRAAVLGALTLARGTAGLLAPDPLLTEGTAP
jgi:glucokinase